jgi:hypothetical protein
MNSICRRRLHPGESKELILDVAIVIGVAVGDRSELQFVEGVVEVCLEVLRAVAGVDSLGANL